MASTITMDDPGGRTVAGSHAIRLGGGNLGTYATNGVTVTAAQFELSVIRDIAVRAAGGYEFEWDKANSKIKAYRQKDPAAAGGADIPLPEVANGVDLSGTTFRFRAEGR